MPDIFIDVDAQEVVRGFADSSSATLPRFVQGDSPTLRIWPLKRTATFNAGIVPYSYLGTAGATFEVAIGTRVGNASTIYTEQLVWTSDANNQSVSAALPLNLPAIDTLIGTNSSGSAWFEVKYLSNGFPTTILDKQIDLQASVIKPGSAVVMPGATSISAESVNATFLKRIIHGAFILQNDRTGNQIAVYFGDDGAFHADPISPFEPVNLLLMNQV
jgi:hypothetical protein